MIVKCFWYPLYHAWPVAQYVSTWRVQDRASSYLRGTIWQFDQSTCGIEKRKTPFEVELRILPTAKSDVFADTLDKVKDGMKLGCGQGQIITKLYLTAGSMWETARVRRKCGAALNLDLKESTLYTFDMSQITKTQGILPWQSLCARDYAVLMQIEFAGEMMISTCRYAVPDCP